ncbi:MAG: TlpA family protein disulfide reductase [Candidatus Sumerlaeaceae bacterium]|nr:TlpA family protein disulfide reductase [Candidatus Sumerlaeaceae bacterium]
MYPVATALAALALTFATGCNAWMPMPLHGHPAPRLTVEKVRQAPFNPDLSWPGLQGKVVVLEFWEPWNDASTAEVAHMNEVASAFEGQNVQFIYICTASEKDVATYVRRFPVKGWLAIDSDQSVFKRYHIGTVPTTVIADEQGIVRYVTKPNLVTVNTIRDVRNDFPGGHSYREEPLFMPGEDDYSTSVTMMRDH